MERLANATSILYGIGTFSWSDRAAFPENAALALTYFG
jgi:hypothetical protein